MPSRDQPTRILFLCSSSAFLSRMAEHFIRERSVDGLEVASAGIGCMEPHPLAVRALAELGADLQTATRTGLADIAGTEFDVVVALTEGTAAALPVLPGNPRLVDWALRDPLADATASDETTSAALRATTAELRRLVDDLVDRGYLSALADAQRCASLILDNVSEGIIAHDMQRRVFYFNRAAEHITGYARKEVIGRDCHQVFPGHLCGGKCLFCDETAPDVEAEQRQVDVVRKDGETRRLDTTCRVMLDAHGSKVGFLLALRDRTREDRLARRVRETQSFAGIIGRDAKMQLIFELIRDLADVDAPILIHGESGTGKELIAAAIHNEGRRAARLFVPVNCGALPEGLLESELFGHVRGAFTGAIRDKKGRFELAHKGTIFLDEIGDLSPAMQVKLLRVLQEGTFERVGGEKTLNVNVRIISATNKDLAVEMAAGRFREDLFFRLNVVPIRVPPLRERRNDIPLLIEHVLRHETQESGRRAVTVGAEALEVMMKYDWPGNVRELQNWLQFALVTCKGEIVQPQHLPPLLNWRSHDYVRPRRKRILDRSSVETALATTKGNKRRAAEVLGVSRATLDRFLDDDKRA